MQSESIPLTTVQSNKVTLHTSAATLLLTPVKTSYWCSNWTSGRKVSESGMVVGLSADLLDSNGFSHTMRQWYKNDQISYEPQLSGWKYLFENAQQINTVRNIFTTDQYMETIAGSIKNWFESCINSSDKDCSTVRLVAEWRGFLLFIWKHVCRTKCVVFCQYFQMEYKVIIE